MDTLNRDSNASETAKPADNQSEDINYDKTNDQYQWRGLITVDDNVHFIHTERRQGK